MPESDNIRKVMVWSSTVTCSKFFFLIYPEFFKELDGLSLNNENYVMYGTLQFTYGRYAKGLCAMDRASVQGAMVPVYGVPYTN